jgi:hypothetical protein
MLLLLPSADVAPLHIPFTSGKVKVKAAEVPGSEAS